MQEYAHGNFGAINSRHGAATKGHSLNIHGKFTRRIEIYLQDRNVILTFFLVKQKNIQRLKFHFIFLKRSFSFFVINIIFILKIQFSLPNPYQFNQKRISTLLTKVHISACVKRRNYNKRFPFHYLLDLTIRCNITTAYPGTFGLVSEN